MRQVAGDRYIRPHPPSPPDCAFLTGRSDTERQLKDEKRLEFASRLADFQNRPKRVLGGVARLANQSGGRSLHPAYCRTRSENRPADEAGAGRRGVREPPQARAVRVGRIACGRATLANERSKPLPYNSPTRTRLRSVLDTTLIRPLHSIESWAVGGSVAHTRPEAAQSISRILYGCVVVLTVLAALGEDPAHPLQDILMVWIAVAGVGLAEAWSEITVKEAALGHRAYWADISLALQHSLWVLPAAMVPTVTFSMSATRQLDIAAAYRLATCALTAFIFAVAARGSWLSGASLFRSAATGVVASGLGYGIAQLRALVH